MDERVGDVPIFWMEDSREQLSFPMKMKRKVRTKKLEFLGWGSKPLIEFLESIGKDTSKQFSQYDVSAIINEYVKENKLIHPGKKKRIICDERLHSLFGRKSVGRNKIYDLLEAHFADNLDETEDELLYSSEEMEESVCKQQKVSGSEKKALHQKKKVIETPKSCFAAILFENIRLVYLKRSLVQELLKYPETFEGKIVGSFVRIKSDPNDYFQKNSHQLVQVSGVRNASGIGDIGTDILLQVSNLVKDIRICMLSDDNFTEEECEDLRQRVRDGFLKRPTVVEFEKKALILHEDITKHWLVRELALLQNLIDRANEKGWRKELFEYMERKQLLQTPSEQSRLLLEAPKVIADELEPEVVPQEDLESGKQYNSGSPRSTFEGASEISTCVVEANQTLPTQNSGSAVTAATFPPRQFIVSNLLVDVDDDGGGKSLVRPSPRKTKESKALAMSSHSRAFSQREPSKENKRENEMEVSHSDTQPNSSSQGDTSLPTVVAQVEASIASASSAVPSIIYAKLVENVEEVEIESPISLNKETHPASAFSPLRRQGSMDDLDAFFFGIEASIDVDEVMTEVPIEATRSQERPYEEEIEKAKYFFISTICKDLYELPDISLELANALSVLTKSFAFTVEQTSMLIYLQEQLPTILADFQSFTKTSLDCDSKLQHKKRLGNRLKTNIAIFKAFKETDSKLTQREIEIEQEIGRLCHELSNIKEEKEKNDYKLMNLHKETIDFNQQWSQLFAEEPKLVNEKKMAQKGIAQSKQLWAELKGNFVNL